MNEKIKDGLHTEWYKNGKKKFEGTYKDDNRTGKFTWWNENGEKDTEITYNEYGKIKRRVRSR